MTQGDICPLETVMNSITVEVVAFFCILAGAACGMALRKILPPEHLSGDSKNTIQAGIGLVVTMTALILGLLVASAKSTYDTEGAELTRMSANAILLDRMLAEYGPEAKSARDALQLAIVHSADLLDSGGQSGPSLRPVTADADVFARIEELSPHDETQRFLKRQASKQAITIGQTHWLLHQQSDTSAVSMPLLITLICWLVIIFASLGMFTPINATTILCMIVCALSVTFAIWLILEMYTPYSGFMHISSAPLRVALASIGH